MKSYFVFLLFLVASCSGNTIPKDVLKPEKMEAVLWDTMLADEMAEYYVIRDTSINAFMQHTGLYKKVFRIHKITQEDFKKSVEFYGTHPYLLKPIFDSLQKRSERSVSNSRPVI